MLTEPAGIEDTPPTVSQFFQCMAKGRAMIEMQVVTLIATIVGIAVGLLAFWRYIEGKIKEAAMKAETAGAALHLLAVQLAEYKTHVAETYVSKAGLREFRDEVMAGVRELKGSVSGLHERIDRIIDAKHPPP